VEFGWTAFAKARTVSHGVSELLTSLFPGLRELRAPLAAGYLWLAPGRVTGSPLFLELSVQDSNDYLVL
jgi:hypothetical protein